MKNFKSSLTSFLVAVTFAGIISCSEQDEIAVPNQSNPGRTVSSRGSSARTSSVVGSELFNTAVGDPLDLTTALSWTANYKAKHPNETRGHFFGTDIIQQILGETGAVGIRIYYALDENGEKKLLLVGVDEAGNDLLPSSSSTKARTSSDDENIVGDFSFPCPNYCPTNSGL